MYPVVQESAKVGNLIRLPLYSQNLILTHIQTIGKIIKKKILES
jgi:hypothetical protein